MGWLLEFNAKPPGNPLPSRLTVMMRVTLDILRPPAQR
jgi:hypothetical protein